MRRALLLLLSAPALLSAAPDALSQAQAEAVAAQAEAARLETAAARVTDEVGRIRAQRAAAAAAISAAEAHLALAATQQTDLQSAADASAARLAAAQQPAAQLLAGLVQLGRRPPLLALADHGSLGELVRARALLDAALPVIRARSTVLAAQLAESRKLASAAAEANAELARRRDALTATQDRFAALEAKANARLASLGGAALGASDRALGASENAEMLASGVISQRDASRQAVRAAAFAEAPARPASTTTNSPPDPEFSWHLPAPAKVLVGLSEISSSGVRSRGLTLATFRGAPLTVPASGKIAFAGPFRRHDGVVIIDHGSGWMTLLTEVRTALTVGTAVAAGEPLGRALGTVTVELRRNGTPQPAALIAGSSATLSKTLNGG
jgi:septal ring factor EnvC (AmiA/AmiB activator)